MRLSELQRGALRKALDGVDGRAYLYGSRTDDSRRGGDVDVLIFSDADPHRLSADVRVRCRMECDERIDVLVVNPARIDSEQRAFLDIIEKDILPINGEISEVNPMGSNDSVSDDGAGAGARENGEDMSERQRRLITSVELWMKMRDVRNRAIHDYQPDQLKRMYDDMMEIFGPELLGCAGEIEKVLERR